MYLQYYKKAAPHEWQVMWTVAPDVQVASLSACPGSDYLVAMSIEVM